MYQLYIGENCHECQFVVDQLKELNINYELYNIDREDIAPPIRIYTLPAIFKGNELMAYGSDIIKYLKNKSSN